jgi:hypothetical protein
MIPRLTIARDDRVHIEYVPTQVVTEFLRTAKLANRVKHVKENAPTGPWICDRRTGLRIGLPAV